MLCSQKGENDRHRSREKSGQGKREVTALNIPKGAGYERVNGKKEGRNEEQRQI